MTETTRRSLARDLILPLVLTAATSFYLADALKSGAIFRYGLPSASFMPIALSLAMYAALLAIVIGIVRQSVKTDQTAAREKHTDGLPDIEDLDSAQPGGNYLATLAVIAACAFYVLTFRPLGFVTSTFLFALSLLAAFRFGWSRGLVGAALNLAVAVAICLLVYVFFAELFGIQLPRMGFLT